MASEKQIILAFDAYGTLLSTESIAKKLADHFGEEKAGQIATTWRTLQLEYTWRLNSMNVYEPFSTVTERSLKHALRDAGVSLDQKDIDALMKAYDSLSIFPDVSAGLEKVRSAPSITAVVFSNGTTPMVSTSIKSSPDLKPYSDVFSDIVVIEEVRKFKPAVEVYHYLGKRVGKGVEGLGDVWLVSGNPFDVVGANSVGMKTCWVDRAGKGWVDGLVKGEKGRPTVIVKGLDEVLDAVKKVSG